MVVYIFNDLKCADAGLCKSANEEHGRDLPIMNGIKEAIKIIGVMNAGSPDYQEALNSLLSRLKKLKVGFRFAEESIIPVCCLAYQLSRFRSKIIQHCRLF